MTAVEKQLARVERAFLAAHQRMCDSPTLEQCEDELSNLLHHLYRLVEVKRGDRKARPFHDEVAGLPELAPVRAHIWVRTYDTHDILITAEPSDGYRDFYTDMYDVLVWASRETFDDGTRDEEYGRRELYDEHLAGCPVLDTVWDAFHAMKAAPL